jgi:hypothetical protein
VRGGGSPRRRRRPTAPSPLYSHCCSPIHDAQLSHFRGRFQHMPTSENAHVVQDVDEAESAEFLKDAQCGDTRLRRGFARNFLYPDLYFWMRC